MQKEKPRRGKAPGRGRSFEITLADITRLPAQNQARPASSPAIDLVGFRERLVAARLRLIEHIHEDWSLGRRFPDTAWTRMLADVQGALAAVDGLMAEDRS